MNKNIDFGGCRCLSEYNYARNNDARRDNNVGWDNIACQDHNAYIGGMTREYTERAKRA